MSWQRDDYGCLWKPLANGMWACIVRFTYGQHRLQLARSRDSLTFENGW